MATILAPVPHFFKVVVFPADHGLKLTDAFTKKYREELKNIVFLKVPNGEQWEVELVHDENGCYLLQNGWKEFAEFYSIELYYFLVFQYLSDSHFLVLIFDPTALEINYPPPSSSSSYMIEQEEKIVEVHHQTSSSQTTCKPKRKSKTIKETAAQRVVKHSNGLKKNGAYGVKHINALLKGGLQPSEEESSSKRVKLLRRKGCESPEIPNDNVEENLSGDVSKKAAVKGGRSSKRLRKLADRKKEVAEIHEDMGNDIKIVDLGDDANLWTSGTGSSIGVFSPSWQVRSSDNFDNLKVCKEFFKHCCPDGVKHSVQYEEDSVFKDNLIKVSCQHLAWECEMLRRYEESLTKMSSFAAEKKDLQKRLKEAEGEISSLKAANAEGFAKYEVVTQNFIAEKTLREKVEKSYGELKLAYKRATEEISEEVYDECVDDFLKSREFLNLVSRMNYQSVKEAYNDAASFVTDKKVDFDKEYNVYLDPALARSYCDPSHAKFDKDRYLRHFPSPEHIPVTSDDVGTQLGVLKGTSSPLSTKDVSPLESSLAGAKVANDSKPVDSAV